MRSSRTPTLTGAIADHRFIAGPRDLHRIVMALAAGILHDTSLSGAPDWMDDVLADLAANHGRVLIHVGPEQPPETHALAHAMNETLGARGADSGIDRALRPDGEPAIATARRTCQ